MRRKAIRLYRLQAEGLLPLQKGRDMGNDTLEDAVLSINDEETVDLLMSLAEQLGKTREEVLVDALQREARGRDLPVT